MSYDSTCLRALTLNSVIHLIILYIMIFLFFYLIISCNFAFVCMYIFKFFCGNWGGNTYTHALIQFVTVNIIVDDDDVVSSMYLLLSNMMSFLNFNLMKLCVKLCLNVVYCIIIFFIYKTRFLLQIHIFYATDIRNLVHWDYRFWLWNDDI